MSITFIKTVGEDETICFLLFIWASPSLPYRVCTYGFDESVSNIHNYSYMKYRFSLIMYMYYVLLNIPWHSLRHTSMHTSVDSLYLYAPKMMEPIQMSKLIGKLSAHFIIIYTDFKNDQPLPLSSDSKCYHPDAKRLSRFQRLTR